VIGDIVFILGGLFHFAGCFGGFLAWGFLLWLYCSRRGSAVRSELRMDVEDPCSYYEEKEDGL